MQCNLPGISQQDNVKQVAQRFPALELQDSMKCRHQESRLEEMDLQTLHGTCIEFVVRFAKVSACKLPLEMLRLPVPNNLAMQFDSSATLQPPRPGRLGAWKYLECGAWTLAPGPWCLDPGAWTLVPGMWCVDLGPGFCGGNCAYNMHITCPTLLSTRAMQTSCQTPLAALMD